MSIVTLHRFQYHTVMSPVIVAAVAAMTFLSSLSRKMSLAEALCSRSVARMAWLLSTGVDTDQYLCQSNLKLLYGFVWQISEVVAKE